MKEFKAGKNEAGQRLDKYLKKILPNASMGFIYKMLRKKNIKLNDKKASGTEIVSSDRKILILSSTDTISVPDAFLSFSFIFFFLSIL